MVRIEVSQLVNLIMSSGAPRLLGILSCQQLWVCTMHIICIRSGNHRCGLQRASVFSIIVLVMITCSKKAPERVQAAAEYSKHRTQINLSSPKKAGIRNG